MARPFRHTLILAVVTCGTLLTAVGGWRYARVSAPLGGPVIIISIDTLRADHLPAYGYTHVKTPAIDRLAADGLVFERAYAHAPQTWPAHAALLSGRLPFETGVRDDADTRLAAGERLLPALLRDRGYVTAGVVSAYTLRKETGIGQGFDFFDDHVPPFSGDANLSEVRRDGGESEAIAEHWLDTVGTARAFLFLHLDEPHAPYTPPSRFAAYAPYDGAIAYSDEIVGRLVQYLKAHQLYERSTIILLSDHGEGLGDHGEQEHGLFLYDEDIHVPLIVKQEGNAGAGRRVTDLAQHIDLVPTLLDLVKAPVPGNLRGRSLKALLDGSGHVPERLVYAESRYGRVHFGWSELSSVVSSRQQYIRAPREELYDLRSDPRERTNIAAAGGPDGVALKKTLAGTAPEPPGPDPKDKVAVLETYRRAIRLAGDRKWPESITLLQRLVREDATLVEVWHRLALFAARIDRFDLSVDAFTQVAVLTPTEPRGFLGAASGFLKLRKLDDARAQAQRALDVSSPTDRPVDKWGQASAHELLARIALARRDVEDAGREAALAQQAEKAWPIPAIVEARLAYEGGNAADALPLLEEAIKALSKAPGLQIPDLHFYAAETLAKLDRPSEAEAEYEEELRLFPQNARAHAGLATLYQATGRSDEAAQALDDMLRVAPTKESSALAARLRRTFGKRKQPRASVRTRT